MVQILYEELIELPFYQEPFKIQLTKNRESKIRFWITNTTRTNRYVHYEQTDCIQPLSRYDSIVLEKYGQLPDHCIVILNEFRQKILSMTATETLCRIIESYQDYISGDFKNCVESKEEMQILKEEVAVFKTILLQF